MWPFYTAGHWVLAAAVICAVSAQAAQTKPEGDADVAAIRAALDSYVAAYNRGDAKVVADHWSDTGEWRSPTGQRFHGRKAIEKELQGIFAANKGVKIECGEPNIRLVSPDVAIEEGTVRVTRPGDEPDDSTYLAIHVKKDGQWKLDSVRETSVPEEPSTSPQLDELGWLVGQWIDQSPDSTVEANVTWTKNKTFLSYAFKVSMPGMDDLEGIQVIGWDPAAGTIRSWMFDSDGGFGEGTWSKQDNHWVVKFSQVLPDGRKGSATNIYTPGDADNFTWRSIGRKVGDEFLPNLEDVKMVRKSAAEPQKNAEKPGKDAERPNKGAEKPNKDNEKPSKDAEKPTKPEAKS